MSPPAESSSPSTSASVGQAPDPSQPPSRSRTHSRTPSTPTVPTQSATFPPGRHHHHRHRSSAAAFVHRRPTPSPAAAAAATHTASRVHHLEDDFVRHGLSKILQKHCRDHHEHRHIPTMEFPDRLKEPATGADDEEVLRPNGQSNGVFMNLNQSIFGLIAAAGSTVNFNNRFEGQSSDEEDEGDESSADSAGPVSHAGHAGHGGHGGHASHAHRLDGTSDSPSDTQTDAAADKRSKRTSKRWSKDASQTTILPKLSGRGSAKTGERRNRLADSRLLRSLPSLKTKLVTRNNRIVSASKGKAVAGDASSSRITEEDELEKSGAAGKEPPVSREQGEQGEQGEHGEPQTPVPTVAVDEENEENAGPYASGATNPQSPTIHITRVERSNSMRSIAPVMSRMLEAKAELAAARPSFDLDRRSSDKKQDADTDTDSDVAHSSALSRKLMEIFDFDKPEEVIDEYPCWLLQSVLLQGYMYITANHICFYAYLPKKANEVSKSGYLAKSGKRNPKYNRYWFRLKGDVLAYYRDPSNLYFPHGQIDLRYGISATVTDRDRDGVHFQVVTHHRTYYFRADSAPSAKEWVKSLQRVIFRSHNDGDSVKISMPIQNVLDVEETQTMVEFADTCKIRVIDNDETYAIDEYFFSFFDDGKDAVRVLRILIEDAAQQQRDRNVDRLAVRQTDDGDSSSGVLSPTSGSVRALNSSPDGLAKTPKLHDSVRATLSALSPVSAGASPRASAELPRTSFDALRTSMSIAGRRSIDAASSEALPRRSFSNINRRSLSADLRQSTSQPAQSAQSAQPSQLRHPLADDMQGSQESVVLSSTEDPSQASFSAVVASLSDNDPSSASQILHGSDIFQGPTMVRRSTSASRRRHKSKFSDVKVPMHASTTSTLEGGRTSTESQSRTDFSIAAAGAGGGQASLQNLAKLGSYPLQRAGAYAGWLNRQSRRMSSLLATESMGYVEKVSGMWKGGHRHYDEPPQTSAMRQAMDDRDLDDEDDQREGGVGGDNTAPADLAAINDRFRAHFALPNTEKLQATYFGYLMRVLPLYGKIYLSDRSFCFRSLLPGTRTKLILPLRDIENVTKEKGFRFGFSGLVVVIRGHEELFFEFGQAEMRDDCAITLLRSFEAARYLRESGLLSADEKAGAETALAERDALQEARDAAKQNSQAGDETETDLGTSMAGSNSNVLKLTESPTILFDDPRASFLNFKPAEPMRITCLTIGSRGDVQPYIALGKGLLAEGHKVKIATHPEFEGWIRSHGLDYGRVEGDPAELMRICIENGTFTLQFLREANAKMRTWLDELLTSAWTACSDAELLIESPSAMAGIHIAEKLQIPYFRAFTMPWTRTRAYPHAFIMPEHKMGGAYNYITYVMFDNVFWKATASQINRWRNKTLGLPNTTLEKMQPNKVPFLYNFSPSVVPPPLDYSDWIRVTGYWFLDEGSAVGQKTIDKAADKPESTEEAKPAWTPPKELTDFIAKARQDKKRIVYVGFGSILVPDPAKMTQEVIDAVLKADVRCILSKGWSDRLAGDNNADQNHAAVEVSLPPEIHLIKSAPHDWLFAQIDAAAHHGGSGTTGASLRAGIPTIIRPFFGDQFFFGGRVEDLGVGICLKKWGAISFARALWEAANSERMINKAAALGEQIRQEHGVDNAIQCIYRDMEYAKSLVRAKASKSAGRTNTTNPGKTSNAVDAAGETADDEDEPEESWTFVGGDESPQQAGSGADNMHQSMILFPEARGRTSKRALGSRVMGTVAV